MHHNLLKIYIWMWTYNFKCVIQNLTFCSLTRHSNAGQWPDLNRTPHRYIKSSCFQIVIIMVFLNLVQSDLYICHLRFFIILPLAGSSLMQRCVIWLVVSFFYWIPLLNYPYALLRYTNPCFIVPLNLNSMSYSHCLDWANILNLTLRVPEHM